MRWLAGPLAATLLAVPKVASGPELLLHAASTRQAAAYSAEQLVAVWNGAHTRTAFVRVQHDPSVGTRLVYRSPGHQRLWVIWHMADRTLEYQPRTREGRSYPAEAPRVDVQQQLSWLARNYQVRWAPGHTLGRSVFRVRILPLHPGRSRVEFHVDAQTASSSRTERVSADGRGRELSVFLNFIPHPVGWMRTWGPPRDLNLHEEPFPRRVDADQAQAHLGRPLPNLQLPAGFSPLPGLFLDGPDGPVRRMLLRWPDHAGDVRPEHTAPSPAPLPSR